MVQTFNGQNFPFIFRSYEEVGWHTKLPRYLKAPETTLAKMAPKMADPVSDRPSSRSYNSRPQLWQVSRENTNGQKLTTLELSRFLFPPAGGS